MKNRSLLFLSLVVFSLLLVGTAVYANSGGEYNEVTDVKYEAKTEAKSAESKVSLSINEAGALYFNRAKFVSLNGSNINVTVAGLPITLSIDSSTQIVGVAGLSSMVSGDILSGKGNINQSTGVITAVLVRDESQNMQRITDLENQIKALLEQLKKLQSEFKTLR